MSSYVFLRALGRNVVVEGDFSHDAYGTHRWAAPSLRAIEPISTPTPAARGVPAEASAVEGAPGPPGVISQSNYHVPACTFAAAFPVRPA